MDTGGRSEEITIIPTTFDFLVGDVREVLRSLPEQSIHCCVTSPPYWGLRSYDAYENFDTREEAEQYGIETCEHLNTSYGSKLNEYIYNATSKDGKHRISITALSIFSGDLDCDHEWGDVGPPHHPGQVPDSKAVHEENARGQAGGSGQYCQCGAWRGCLGLEPTPELYIEHMLEVCRELWRVLRDDGTFWLNMGDCYASSGAGSWGSSDKSTLTTGSRKGSWAPGNTIGTTPKRNHDLKVKDLVMMPGRLAGALQADGWWVRSKIIWEKPNPMPESCTDRPTSSYEEIFELTKSGKPTYWVNAYRGTGARKQPEPDYLYFDLVNNLTFEVEPEGFDTEAKDNDDNPIWKKENQWRGHDYFYDVDAVREPHTSIPKGVTPRAEGWKDKKPTPREGAEWIMDSVGIANRPKDYFGNVLGRNLRNVWEIDEDEFQQFLRWKAEWAGELSDVWKIVTQPYPAAHFATFPERIPEICIEAGTSERGACPSCGAPWERVMERAEPVEPVDYDGKWSQADPQSSSRRLNANMRARRLAGGPHQNPFPQIKTTGFQPTCDCDPELDPVPCIVLDPFVGSGTTLQVARRLGRSSIGIDINESYRELALDREVLKNQDLFSYGRSIKEPEGGDL